MAIPLSAISPGPIDFDELQRLIGADARVVLEIGAHHGWHTNIFLQKFPRATVHAFEPDDRARAMFKQSVSDTRVRLHEIAIGAADGPAPFYVSSGLPPNLPQEHRARYPQGWDQSGSLRRPTGHADIWPWVKFERTVQIPVRRLDTWAAEHRIGPVDFIWADMQGAEVDLIRGGGSTLAMTRFLYAEYSNEELYEGEPSLPTLLSMLPTFSIVKLFPNDVLLRNNAA
jgi:2-O-methyltransferase